MHKKYFLVIKTQTESYTPEYRQSVAFTSYTKVSCMSMMTVASVSFQCLRTGVRLWFPASLSAEITPAAAHVCNWYFY